MIPAGLDVDGSQGRALSAAVDARWDELVAAAELEGVLATHCGAAGCFGADGWLCECSCSACQVALALHVRAELEVAPAARAELGEALAAIERGLHVPEAAENRILAQLRGARVLT